MVINVGFGLSFCGYRVLIRIWIFSFCLCRFFLVNGRCYNILKFNYFFIFYYEDVFCRLFM